MNEYKKLVKNTGVFAIANLGSKLLSVILVPFYTYYLSKEQYGTIDMIMTTISLLLPLITLSIFQATLRFAVKSKYDGKSIFSSSLIVSAIGNMLFLLAYPILMQIDILKEYLNLFYIVVLLQSINSTFSQFARGIGMVKVFALNGVINTFITLVLNIILLAKFDMGIQGYFISIVIANVVCNVYLIVASKLWRHFSVRSYNKSLIKEMLIYSIPLIPNSLMWWIMNASDRYIINIFIGVSFNGLYAVAHKVPTLLNLLNSIFSQAWQLSAIEQGDSESKSKFYTNVFNLFSIVMLIGTSIILLVIKPAMILMLDVEFSTSWKYVPFLLLAVVFSSFSAFLGTNYIAMKETKGVFKTSFAGAIINIVLNIIFLPIIGLNGAAIATMISFFIVWVMRIYDTRKFVNIKLNIRKMSITFIIIFAQVFFMFIEGVIPFILNGLLLAGNILINIDTIKDIWGKIKSNFLRQKGESM